MKLNLSSVPYDHPVLISLTQFYLYDLSEIEPFDIIDTGQFQDVLLQKNATHSDIETFLIYGGNQLIGFAIVSRQSKLRSQFSGHTMEALFVLRRYRRHGLGRNSACEIFDHFPGTWEVATHGLNVRGMAFWRSVIDAYTNGNYGETWLQEPNWRGTVHSFEAPYSHCE